MLDIEMKYNDIENDLDVLYTIAYEGIALSDKYDTDDDGINSIYVYIEQIRRELEESIAKAKTLEIDRFKRSQGGKKSANNMTKRERIARARRASHSRH
jgi:hypothetical protein